MKLNTTYISLISLLTLTACSSDLSDILNGNSGKEEVTFTTTNLESSVVTRAGFADGNTAIFAKMKSEANNKTTQWTATTLLASKDTTNSETSTSSVSYNTVSDTRFWDDTHGREANISVYAVAIANNSETTNTASSLLSAPNQWTDATDTNSGLSFDYTVSKAQNVATTSFDQYDLVYSNNITNGTTDARLKFTPSSDNNGHTGSFDKGSLLFNHALTKITVNLLKGNGFEGDFASAKTSVMIGSSANQPTLKGNFDVSSGEWALDENTKGEVSATVGTLLNSYNVDNATYAVIPTNAIVMPGYTLRQSNTNTALTITVSDNLYYVSEANLYAALQDVLSLSESSYAMAQGYHYIFNIELNKTGIKVTASLADWNSVVGETQNPSNARISVEFLNVDGSSAQSNVNLYRLLDEAPEISDDYVGMNWNGNYGSAATVETDGITNWYFDSNKSYYHFRTTNVTPKANNDGWDYVPISNGKRYASNPIWGAPMKGNTISYSSTNGFTNCLISAIGPTWNTIHLTQLHMLSQLDIYLTTTTGTDAVTLEGSTVVITGMNPEGQVLMGSGKINATGTVKDVTMTAPSAGTVATTPFTWDVVPQTLSHIGLIITTGDHNKYVISDLSTIVETGTSSTISEWIPGTHYTYTFDLRKTDVKASVSLADWTTKSASAPVWF
ncbi:fimbrillin family protein [Segatella bryantii]|uniref:fimbrillin family protein n=1 Tax=Segatella bryantii TaxID=77095 RepID=UPI0028534CDD|nr:fimbrillin family protein [Segatella bryantii]MDR4930963.1 fimbrillin family protein [Segatella bryantii]